MLANICLEQSNKRQQLHKRRRIIEGNQPMWVEGAEPDKDEWVTWRLLPAQVSDEEIAKLENALDGKVI